MIIISDNNVLSGGVLQHPPILLICFLVAFIVVMVVLGLILQIRNDDGFHGRHLSDWVCVPSKTTNKRWLFP